MSWQPCDCGAGCWLGDCDCDEQCTTCRNAWDDWSDDDEEYEEPVAYEDCAECRKLESARGNEPCPDHREY